MSKSANSANFTIGKFTQAAWVRLPVWENVGILYFKFVIKNTREISIHIV